MSDSLIAIQGKDFVIIAADSAHARSILVVKESGEDKIMHFDSHKLLAACMRVLIRSFLCRD
jgi:20S proteasome alpha/beta subunit